MLLPVGVIAFMWEWRVIQQEVERSDRPLAARAFALQFLALHDSQLAEQFQAALVSDLPALEFDGGALLSVHEAFYRFARHVGGPPWLRTTPGRLEAAGVRSLGPGQGIRSLDVQPDAACSVMRPTALVDQAGLEPAPLLLPRVCCCGACAVGSPG